ncbi:hypothetical protein KIPB_007210 [Kipferlia bialata]|uniref:Uncharacterized protein n=1 Tax=Kipferlia bialata TaxID=797122 RepID=A0A9K3CYD6_9EUKA|nr:hypothetical protein KIPB_007210 [Kipferlia bialata]|eukprot:g7210.t1
MKYHYICTHNGNGGNGQVYPVNEDGDIEREMEISMLGAYSSGQGGEPSDPLERADRRHRLTGCEALEASRGQSQPEMSFSQSHAPSEGERGREGEMRGERRRSSLSPLPEFNLPPPMSSLPMVEGLGTGVSGATSAPSVSGALVDTTQTYRGPEASRVREAPSDTINYQDPLLAPLPKREAGTDRDSERERERERERSERSDGSWGNWNGGEREKRKGGDNVMTGLMQGAHLAGNLDLRSLCRVSGTPSESVLAHTIRCFVHMRSSLHPALRPTLKYLFPCPYSQQDVWNKSCMAVLPLPGRNDVGILFPAQMGSVQEAVRFSYYVQWDFPVAGWAIE